MYEIRFEIRYSIQPTSLISNHLIQGTASKSARSRKKRQYGKRVAGRQRFDVLLRIEYCSQCYHQESIFLDSFCNHSLDRWNYCFNWYDWSTSWYPSNFDNPQWHIDISTDDLLPLGILWIQRSHFPSLSLTFHSTQVCSSSYQCSPAYSADAP